jgi:predicted RNA methylase
MAQAVPPSLGPSRHQHEAQKGFPMAKLSKRELAAHQDAVQLLQRGNLSLDDKEQILRDWHEGAGGDQTAASAYFTPIKLANDMVFEMPSHGSFVDLCAGTGRLAYFAGGQHRFEPHQYSRIVCVERNPLYVAVGKQILPQAEWICGDALDPEVIRQIGQVDVAIANPPFGTITRSDYTAPRYKGARIDLAVMDVAATLAPECWAIVPRNLAPWDHRGDRQESPQAEAFTKATGLGVHRFASVEPDYYRDQWRGTAPAIELVGFGEHYEEEERRSFRTIHEPTAPARAPEQLALI